MIRSIAACAFSTGLFVLMMFAQNKSGGGMDSPSPAPIQTQSVRKWAPIESVDRVSEELPVAASAWLQADACSDPIDNCKDPVKYLGPTGSAPVLPANPAGQPSITSAHGIRATKIGCAEEPRHKRRL